MADFDKIILENTPLDVKDASARQTAQAASALSTQNAQDIVDLKALSRLTVSYDPNTETITFTTATHN